MVFYKVTTLNNAPCSRNWAEKFHTFGDGWIGTGLLCANASLQKITYEPVYIKINTPLVNYAKDFNILPRPRNIVDKGKSFCSAMRPETLGTQFAFHLACLGFFVFLFFFIIQT